MFSGADARETGIRLANDTQTLDRTIQWFMQIVMGPPLRILLGGKLQSGQFDAVDNVHDCSVPSSVRFQARAEILSGQISESSGG